MPYQMNDMQGSLFTNSYKNPQDPNDRSPHFKGRCIIQGVEWELAAWWSYPQNGGQPYLQLKFQTPRPRQQQGAPQQGGYPPQQGYAQPQYQQRPPQQPYQGVPASQPRGGYAPAPQSGYQGAPAQPPQGGYAPAPAPQGYAAPAQGADDLPFD